jgi:hypothetical protein
LNRFFVANSLVAGILALLWLVLRSGPKPSRLAYPCQQAAFSAASLAFGAPLVSALIAARRHIAGGMRRPAGIAAVGAVIVGALGVSGLLDRAAAIPVRPMNAPDEYRAQLFHVSGCPEDPTGERFPGLDVLMKRLGSAGIKLHDSATTTPYAGPGGIVGSDDVVVIKINYQWPQRGGSNTDVLRGLIRLILDHPDGFVGEVVIAENTQFAGADNFDRTNNNAQDHGLSPRDVADHFADLGHQVSLFDWTAIRFDSVAEYSSGDMRNGYVVYPYDSGLNGRISYPKFQTDHGRLVSLRDGIWDPGDTAYDRDRLVVINLPVLKSHHSTYGITACVKNYMGLVSAALDTNSHNGIGYGLMGAVMAEAGPPDLHILDAIWVNADPYTGPTCSYEGATRRDELVAGVDPVAIDRWAANNILIPAMLDNGFSPPWPEPSADPDDPTSDFRIYLDNSMNALLAAGYASTNDPNSIDVDSVDLQQLIFADGFEWGDDNEWSRVEP